jgi:hypothetical protein
MQSTGVPCSAFLMDELRKVYATMQGHTSEVRDLKTKLPEIVQNAIEDKATESGQVTATFVMDRLKEAVDDATGKWDPIISKAVENATSKWGFPLSGGGGNAGGDVSYSRSVSVSKPGLIGPRSTTLYKSYKYHNPSSKWRCNWDVPADFDFPTAVFMLHGQLGYWDIPVTNNRMLMV